MKLLILSDIHGNWPALRAVLRAEPDADQILCLGDLVNYGPQPAECVAWAMQHVAPEWLVQGNHDRAFALGVDAHCVPPYQLVADAVQSATSHLLTREMKRWLASALPLRKFELGASRCVACHAIPSDPLYGYLGEASGLSLWESELVRAGHPALLFVGHTHVPMKTQFQRTLLVNPGSVGQPKDGDPRAAYAVWQDGKVEFRRAAYDVEETVRAYEPLPVEEHVKRNLIEDLRTGGRPQPSLKPVETMTYGSR